MKHARSVDKKLVYEAVKRIPRGKVSSYGAVAREVGVPGAARAIGSIMRGNPYAPVVPCHRVVYSDGRLGGFGGKSHIPKKARLLRSEGVRVTQGRIADFSRVFFDFGE
ncbi:MAG TPA: MGMT family protein [Thermoproteota archaeon]|nr:MGMT family protein [Thermoproteota archaeon]